MEIALESESSLAFEDLHCKIVVEWNGRTIEINCDHSPEVKNLVIALLERAITTLRSEQEHRLSTVEEILGRHELMFAPITPSNRIESWNQLV